MSEVAKYFTEEEIRRVEKKTHSQYSDILGLANFIQYKKNQILGNKNHYLLTIYLKNLIFFSVIVITNCLLITFQLLNCLKSNSVYMHTTRNISSWF